MQIILATGNQHKAEEISAQLPTGFELSLQSSHGVSSVAETGSTFIENALIKARHASAGTGLPALSDDSGLCVEALAGAPGIFSARYAGTNATDTDNVNKLLEAMAHVTQRRAFFYCVLVFLQHPDDPVPIIAEGRWQGTISQSASGHQGFGYDPIFFLPELDVTAAQLDLAEKNALSHRGQALEKLAVQLVERYPA